MEAERKIKEVNKMNGDKRSPNKIHWNIKNKENASCKYAMCEMCVGYFITFEFLNSRYAIMSVIFVPAVSS